MVDVLWEIWGAVCEAMICSSMTWSVYAVLENCWSESCMNVSTSVPNPDPGSLQMPSADPVDKFASVSESIGMSATNGWTLGCKRDVCSRSSSVSWWSILPQQCISIYSSQLVLKMGVARISAMLTEFGLSCGASISVVFWSSWLVEKACRETSRISQCNAISTAMPWLEGISLVPRLPHPRSRHKKLMSAGMAMQEYLTAHPTRGYSVTVILVAAFLCLPSNIEDTVQSLLYCRIRPRRW